MHPAPRQRLWPAAVLALLLTGSAGAYVPGASLPEPVMTARPRASVEAGPADFEQMLSELESSEKRLEKELDELGPKIDTVKRRMVARGRAYYRLVRAGLLPVGGGFDSLVDHAATVERIRAALARDVELERALSMRQASATEELKRVKTERAPLMVQREAMHRARAAMQQADERRAAFARAFGGSTSLPHLAIYGAGADTVSEGAVERFSAMKGRLSLPLAGRAEVLTPPEPMRGAEGLTLLASRDTAVRAVYAGRVTFAGETKHGGTIVVDHGERYFSVYGGLSRIEVRQGVDLPERATLGWILRTSSESPRLYFEIRRGQRLLDAAPWLGL